MKTIRYFLSCMFVVLLTYSIQGKAQDIDLYSSVTSVTGSDLPNVLFIWDNAAATNGAAPACTYADTGLSPNLGATSQGIEQCALNNAIYALQPAASGSALVNVGIMVYNKAGLTCYSSSSTTVAGVNSGGCLIYPLTPMTAVNKIALMAQIKSWASPGIQSSNEGTAEAVQEAWAYYANKTGMSGTAYTSPALTGCQKNYVVFIGNAATAAGTPSNSGTPGALLTSIITNPPTALTATQQTLLSTTITIPSGTYGVPPANNSCGSYTMPPHTETSGLYADEWARYMKDVDLVSGVMPGNKKIFTYAIGVLTSSCKPDYPALLTSMASKGGGKYFSTGNATEIQQAIIRIINEVQAVNSVFASSSLPVSVNAQGTYLNQIYMGMFRPDAGGQPRWYGNLKQYQFIYNSTTKILQLADATKTPAISAAGTGFMSPNAASFWDCTSAGNTPFYNVSPYNVLPANGLCSPIEPSMGFWANQTSGVGNAYDLPDGEMVEKGGAAMVMRLANLTDNYTLAPGPGNPRNLYTCPSGGCGAGVALSAPFDTTNTTGITDVLLGTGSRAVTSITSAATVIATSAASGGGGTAATISITALAKSGSTVTATVSAADLAKILAGTQLNIATGAAKYDCNPCTVTAVNPASNTFTYADTGGGGTPNLSACPTISPSGCAKILSNLVVVTPAGPPSPFPSVSQTVTFSSCSVLTGLNGTVATIMATTATTFTVATTLAVSGTDAACRYTPNIATVTSTAHGFSNGASITIAGATPAGYNGTWYITVVNADTFTYQYTVAAPLGAAGAATATASITRDTLTKWVRGEDNLGDEHSLCPPGTVAGTGNCPSPAVNIRPSVHGDVLHSRPVVINYGGTIGVVVFYGANDGVFRAVNGNQYTTFGTPPVTSTLPAPGSELWGFIPNEFYSSLKRLHDNSPIVKGPSTLAGIIPAPQPKDYFADGSTGVYQLIKTDGTTQTAYLYLAMRRGGRFIYALDVSTPTAPTFLWKVDTTGLTNASGFTPSANYSELGQTWSQPKVAMVRGYASPVLIFGAGYDPAEDSDPPLVADTMGRGIYILDATTGALIWKATYGAALSCPNASAACTLPGMNYSIPSDITLLDKNNDGKIDRLYVGDVGGNVWRVDLEPTAGSAPANWQVEKLAALGCATAPCILGTTPRKIFYPPEVMSVSGYDAVFAGSGDREHPLYSAVANSACQVANRLYMLKDTHTGMDGNLPAMTTITEQPGSASPFNLFNSTSIAYDGSLSGYYITLAACEKAVNAPLAVAGYVYFGTNKAEAPKPNVCEEPLGEAASYRLKPFAGTYTSGEWESGGLPPSPVAGVVNVIDSATGKPMQVPFCIGCGVGENATPGQTSTCDGSALAACRPPIDVSTSRYRTYWYMNTD